jgi:GNAT superfamily N-acetyltransferase
MHAHYYAREHAFGLAFEAKVARELAEFAQRLDHPLNQLWLGLDNTGRCVGSIAIDAQDLGGGIAHLRWFMLDDRHRGQGLGRALLERAVQSCDEHGLAAIHLWTFRGLDAARHLYESVGFQLADERSGKQWGTPVAEQRFERIRPV